MQKGIKHEWEQSVKESSHSLLDRPRVLLSARLRLLRLAVWSCFSAFSLSLELSILLVTAKSSSCPPDHFFRFDLHERSYQVSHLKSIFRSAFRWKASDYPKIIFHLGQFSKTEVSSNLSPSWINLTMNFLTVNRWLMNFESKLSGSASAFPKCRS